MSVMTFVWGDDWSGVYIDGELVDEGHSISAYSAAEIAIEKRATELQGWPCDIEWLHDQGSLPKLLSDVKREP
jgi:hypothetical protein